MKPNMNVLLYRHLKGGDIIMPEEHIITKYKKLNQACCIYPAIQLTLDGKAITEDFMSEKVVDNFAEGGFVEEFCLTPEQGEKVRELRKSIKR